jgi:hypothetical protein
LAIAKKKKKEWFVSLPDYQKETLVTIIVLSYRLTSPLATNAKSGRFMTRKSGTKKSYYKKLWSMITSENSEEGNMITVEERGSQKKYQTITRSMRDWA